MRREATRRAGKNEDQRSDIGERSQARSRKRTNRSRRRLLKRAACDPLGTACCQTTTHGTRQSQGKRLINGASSQWLPDGSTRLVDEASRQALPAGFSPVDRGDLADFARLAPDSAHTRALAHRTVETHRGSGAIRIAALRAESHAVADAEGAALARPLHRLVEGVVTVADGQRGAAAAGAHRAGIACE